MVNIKHTALSKYITFEFGDHKDQVGAEGKTYHVRGVELDLILDEENGQVIFMLLGKRICLPANLTSYLTAKELFDALKGMKP